MRIMHKINKGLKYVLITLFAINLVLFGYICFGQVDVIENDTWKINLDKTSYREGDTIVATSEYTKLRQVSGTSKRYLECKNANGGDVRYPLQEAVADRIAGTNSTGINLIVPEIKEAPTQCYVYISIRYEIFKPFRYHTEQNRSADIQILLKETALEPVPQEPTATSNNSVSRSETPNSSTKNVQPAPNNTTNNTDNSVTNNTTNNPPAEPVEPEPQRGLVTQVLDLLNPLR